MLTTDVWGTDWWGTCDYAINICLSIAICLSSFAHCSISPGRVVLEQQFCWTTVFANKQWCSGAWSHHNGSPTGHHQESKSAIELQVCAVTWNPNALSMFSFVKQNHINKLMTDRPCNSVFSFLVCAVTSCTGSSVILILGLLDRYAVCSFRPSWCGPRFIALLGLAVCTPFSCLHPVFLLHHYLLLVGICLCDMVGFAPEGN